MSSLRPQPRFAPEREAAPAVGAEMPVADDAGIIFVLRGTQLEKGLEDGGGLA